ncbi:MAG: hypothetical protein J0I12_01820 [Candidatus Eremiobacteraeota bacterium]|nr:hypothetical protein [Candidatus Eremiobacteraeota bacterium]
MLERMTISLEDAAKEAHLSLDIMKDWADKRAFLSQKRGDGSLLLDRSDFYRWLQQLPPRRCDLDGDKKWYSFKEIVKLTGVPLPILQRDKENGILRCQETRDSPVVEESDLNRWMREGRHAEPEPEYWPLPRAAKFVGLNYEVLVDAARDGKLPTREEPHFYLGKRQVVNPKELLHWLESIPYRKEAAHLPGTVDVAEVSRLTGFSLEKVRGFIGDGGLHAWEDRIPRRSLDQWLKKRGLPLSWQEKKAEPAPPPVLVPSVEWSLTKITQRWGVPRHALESGIESGALPARQAGRAGWLVEEVELERWMDERSRIS